jgi:hypothetical protein
MTSRGDLEGSKILNLEGLKPDFGPRYQLLWNDENQEL